MTSSGHFTFLPITFDRKEIETRERCQSVRLTKTDQLICNMTCVMLEHTWEPLYCPVCYMGSFMDVDANKRTWNWKNVFFPGLRKKDMQHDLLRSLVDLDLMWPYVKITNWSFNVKKHIIRSGLTRGTHWCQNNSPNLCSSEVIDTKLFPQKRKFYFWWPLVHTLLIEPPIWRHRLIAKVQGYHLAISKSC